jgi:hypothetical protein
MRFLTRPRLATDEEMNKLAAAMGDSGRAIWRVVQMFR